MGAPYVAEFLSLGLSRKTANTYAGVLRRAEPFLASRGVTIATCGAEDVAELCERVRRSHASRGHLRAALRAAWVVEGRVDPPIKAVRVPPPPPAECRALEPDAAAMLEQAAWKRDDDPGLAVLIGMYAALRRFEIAAVHTADVARDDLGRPTWFRVVGKWDKTREVPIHPALSGVLLRAAKSGFFFPGRFGGHVCPDTIWRWTKLVAVDAGLNLTTHQLRHTALAEANDRSGDLRTTQAFAGHSRPETTATYTRTTRTRLARVVSMIDYGRHSGGEEVPA